ncbi:MAG: hypothetical protein ABH878_08955 [bacterium]
MKVFLCWSGELSHKVALVFEEWLPTVIPRIEPFISSEDIAKGSLWFPEIKENLATSKFGVVLLTRENTSEPWIYFESGALSITKEKGQVSPFLFDIRFSDVKGPLAQFQCTAWDKEDIRKLLKSINKAEGSTLIDEETLNKNFESKWKELDDQLNNLILTRNAQRETEKYLGLELTVGSPIQLPLPPLRIAAINVNCHFFNKSQTGITIKRMNAELCLPDGRTRCYRWECFYIYEPDRTTQKGISDPIPFTVTANGGVDKGIQFVSEENEKNTEEFTWGVGNYYLTLKVWNSDKSFDNPCDITQRFHFEISQMQFAEMELKSDMAKLIAQRLSEKTGISQPVQFNLFPIQMREIK